MGGGGSNVYNPPTGNLQAQNANLNSTLNQSAAAVNNYAPTVAGQAGGITSSILNNPYQAAAQTGAGTASNFGMNYAAPQSVQAGASLQGLGNINAGYAPQALASGFDPQNALYNRNYGQTIDQSNAINSMSGVSGTPYGAGVTGQVANNFNLDWLNQALGRQNTAANTAGTLSQTAGNAFTGAGQQNANALNTYTTASALPSQTYQQNLSQQLAALSGQNTAVGGAVGINDQLSQVINQYLQYGTNAQQTNYQDSASALGGLGSLFGSILGAGGGQGAGSSIFSDAIFAL